MNSTTQNNHPAGNFNAANYLEMAGVMLLVINDSDEIIWANRKGCEILGYENPGELSGKDFFEFFPADIRAKSKSNFYKAKKEGSGNAQSFEAAITSASGENKLVLLTISVANNEAGKTATLISGEDVTQARNNEAELKTIRERIDFALKSSKLGVWEWNINSNNIYWSNELKELYGLQGNDDVVTFEDYIKKIHPDDRDALSDRVTRAIEQGEPYTAEHRIVRSDGNTRWVLGKGRPVYSKSGAVEKISGIAVDITEQKEREEQLHFQANILQNMQEAVLVMTNEGKITFYNEGASGIFGFHEAEVLDENWSYLFSPENNRQNLPHLEEVSSGNEISIDLAGKTSQGNIIWLNLNLSPLYSSNGDQIGILAIGQDITQKKKAEEDRKLLQHIGQKISHSEGIEEALSNTLQIVGQHIGWHAAEAWLPVWGGEKILKAATWKKGEDAKTHNKPEFIESNNSLQGQILNAGKAAWLMDPENLKDVQLNRPHNNIKTAIGLPVMHKNEVQAILMFFTEEEKNEDIEILNILQSIANQLAADIYLKLQQSNLQHFYELSSDLMVISTPEGKVLRMNPAMQNLVGHNKKFASETGRTRDFIHPQDLAERDLAVSRLNAENPDGDLVTRINSGANLFRWIHWHFKLDTNKGLIYSIGRDITEQKKLEDAIQNIEMGTAGYSGKEYFTFLVKYLSMLLDAEYALAGTLEGEDKDLVQTLAFASNGRELQNISFSLNDTPLSNSKSIGITAANGGIKKNFTNSFLVKEFGADSLFGCFLLNGSGGKEGVLMVFSGKPVQDDSAAKMLLQIFSVRAANELVRDRSFTDIKNMNQALKERTRQLTEVNHDLETLSKAVSQDLRNPLFNLSTAITEVEKSLNADTPGLQKLKAAGSELRLLLNSIIDYSQAQAVQPTYDLTNFNRVLEIVKNNIAKLLEEKNVRIEVKNLPTLVANEDQMAQLFETLISTCIRSGEQPTEEIIVEGFDRDDKYEFIIHYSDCDLPLSTTKGTNNQTFTERKGISAASEVNYILMKLIVENHGGKMWHQNNKIYFTIAN